MQGNPVKPSRPEDLEPEDIAIARPIATVCERPIYRLRQQTMTRTGNDKGLIKYGSCYR